MAHRITVSIYQPTVTRKKKDGSKKTTKSKVWWMEWRQNGVRQRESTGARQKQVARTLANQKEQDLLLGRAGLVDRFAKHRAKTWDELCKQFLADVKVRNRPGTHSQYAMSLDLFNRALSPKKLAEVDRAMLSRYVAKRLEDGAKPATVGRDLRTLRRCLNWAVEQGWIEAAPRFKGLTPRSDLKKPDVVPVEDYVAMLAAVDRAELVHRSADWWRVFLQMAYITGARLNEIISVRWSHVNFSRGELTIPAEGSKGRRDRTFDLAVELRSVLLAWRGSKPAELEGTDLVLPWRVGKSRRRLYVDWNRIVAAAGIPKERRRTPQDFRSNCASQLAADGKDSTLARDMLGHASVTTTERYYTNTTEGLKLAVASRSARAEEANRLLAELRAKRGEEEGEGLSEASALVGAVGVGVGADGARF